MDENCDYFMFVNNPKSNIPSRCVVPSRYQEYKESKNSKETSEDFSCCSNDYQNCPWFLKNRSLLKLILK